ncbi:MAG TPA: hypothetical protein VN046_03440, partial [Stenotrophobium sp.]|nr:hypothetical protein [Stenotrophobium sp.]
MSAEALIGVAASDEGVASEPLVPRSSRSRWYRGNIILWLRRTHGWIGLWGAALGLLFGGSGILLNHRSVLRIPAAHAEVSTAQIPLPQPYPADAADLGRWLQGALALQAGATRVREEPAQAVAWGDHDLRQPAHWSMSFTTPNANVQADWW